MKLLLLAVCLLFLHEGHSYGSWYGSRPWYGDYWYGGGSRGRGGYKGYGGYGGLYKGYGNHHRHRLHRRNAENDMKIHVSGMSGATVLPAEHYEGGHPGHFQPHHGQPHPLPHGHDSKGPRHEPPYHGHGPNLKLNDEVALPGHREHQRAPGHGPREQVSHDPFKLQHRGPSPVDHSSRPHQEPRHPEPRSHHEPRTRRPEPFYPPGHEQEVDHYDILVHQSLSKPPMPTQVFDRDHSYENVKEAGFTPFLFNNKETRVDYPADMHGVPQEGPHHGPLRHPQGPPPSHSGPHDRNAWPEQAGRPEHQLFHESGHRVAESAPHEQPEHMTWPGPQGPRHQGPPLRHQPEHQGWSEHQQALTHVSGHRESAPQEQPGHHHQGPPAHHHQPAWPRNEERRPDHGPRHEQSGHHRASSSHRDSDFVEFINEEDGLHDSNSKPEEWLESLEH